MLDTPVTRRRFARWLAASPVALGWRVPALAAWNNVATPPVFATIEPAPIKSLSAAVQLFGPNEVVLLDGPMRRRKRRTSPI